MKCFAGLCSWCTGEHWTCQSGLSICQHRSSSPLSLSKPYRFDWLIQWVNGLIYWLVFLLSWWWFLDHSQMTAGQNSPGTLKWGLFPISSPFSCAMDAHELSFCILSQIPVLIHDANAFELFIREILVPKKSTFPSALRRSQITCMEKGLSLESTVMQGINFMTSDKD